MTKQTKLVDCGATVFIYDLHARRKTTSLNFEKTSPLGELTNLKRLILANFVSDELLAMFRLSIPLSQYKNAQIKLDTFINHLSKASGSSHIDYLAVAELPLENSKSTVYLHLITSLEINLLTSALGEEISEEDNEDYFSNIWGDEVLVGVAFNRELLDIFDSGYHKSINSDAYTQYQKVIFKSRLRQPKILWNESAEKFIKKHNLLDYPYHRSEEFFDEAAGWVNANEYSLYNTSSIATEQAMFDSID